MEQTKKKRPFRKQIVFDISEEDHVLIKQIAHDNKMTMRRWIVYAMADAVRKHEKEKA